MDITVNSNEFKEDVELAANYLPELSQLSGKTVLITGATGLIGKMLVFTLAKMNAERDAKIKIIALSRNFEKANDIFFEINDQNLFIVSRDITIPFDIEKVNQIDIVIHAAADTNSKRMANSPIQVIESIYDGTKNVLEFAIKHKTTKFIFLSSMEVYGTTTLDDGSITENFNGRINLHSTRSSYPEAKRLSELLVYSYGIEKKISTTVLRLTQTFGPGVNITDSRVFATFVREALLSKKIVLKTKGETIRSYLYLRDAITAILHVVDKIDGNETYNLSNEKATISIYEMAKKISDIIHDVQIVVDENNVEKQGFAPKLQMRLSNKKIRATGWNAEIGIDEMLRRLIESLRDQV